MVASDLSALDVDRLLALSYVPARRRPAVCALWQLDATLGAVLRGRGDPALRQIKLAWWREALERLDREPAPAQPALAAVQEHVIARGVSGVRLAAMEAGWSELLEPGPLSPEQWDVYAAERGGRIFAATAELLGAEPLPDVVAAGEGWGLVDLARHSSRSDEAIAVRRAGAARLRGVSLHWRWRLRPLGMLAMLARRDTRGPEGWERPGAPSRMFRMLSYRLTGR